MFMGTYVFHAKSIGAEIALPFRLIWHAAVRSKTPVSKLDLHKSAALSGMPLRPIPIHRESRASP